MLSSRLPSRTTYRSVRYCSSRDEKVRTADASSMPKFRIKKNSQLQSTMMRTGGLLEQQMSKTITILPDQATNQHLKSFVSMMDSDNRKITIEEKNTWSVKPLKFRILKFQDLEESEFSLLDPYQRHFTSVEDESKKLSKQIEAENKEAKLLRGQLLNLKNKIMADMSAIEKTGMSQLFKFKSLLTQNQTKQQQIKLKFKRDLAKLEQEHDNNCEEFEHLHGKNLNLQNSIFQCEPYELKENDDWAEFSHGNQSLGIKQGTSC